MTRRSPWACLLGSETSLSASFTHEHPLPPRSRATIHNQTMTWYTLQDALRRSRVLMPLRTRSPDTKRAPANHGRERSARDSNSSLASSTATWPSASRKGGGARSRSGRCTAARARNRPFERPTHATVGALGVVCANGCAGSPAQCHAWHADWWCPWPPPLRRWEARVTRIGGSSSCRGSWDARANPGELTQRTAPLNTSEPRCTAVGRMRGGVTTELCYRLFDFLAQVLGSPLRRKSNLS